MLLEKPACNKSSINLDIVLKCVFGDRGGAGQGTTNIYWSMSLALLIYKYCYTKEGVSTKHYMVGQDLPSSKYDPKVLKTQGGRGGGGSQHYVLCPNSNCIFSRQTCHTTSSQGGQWSSSVSACRLSLRNLKINTTKCLPRNTYCYALFWLVM